MEDMALIVCPSDSGSMFLNYKNFFSVLHQTLVDANYKFNWMEVVGYGKQTDGGIFMASELFNLIEEKIKKYCFSGTRFPLQYWYKSPICYYSRWGLPFASLFNEALQTTSLSFTSRKAPNWSKKYKRHFS